MNDDQFNQLHKILTSVETRISGLEKGQHRFEQGQSEIHRDVSSLQKGQGSIEDRLNSVEVQLQSHAQQSKQQHDDIVTLLLDSTEVNDKDYKKKLSDHEERISTLEKHIKSA